MTSRFQNPVNWPSQKKIGQNRWGIGVGDIGCDQILLRDGDSGVTNNGGAEGVKPVRDRPSQGEGSQGGIEFQDLDILLGNPGIGIGSVGNENDSGFGKDLEGLVVIGRGAVAPDASEGNPSEEGRIGGIGNTEERSTDLVATVEADREELVTGDGNDAGRTAGHFQLACQNGVGRVREIDHEERINLKSCDDVGLVSLKLCRIEGFAPLDLKRGERGAVHGEVLQGGDP